MHFFEQQKVDAIGAVGVSLQKSLIFLMVITLLGVFSGMVLPSILGLGLLWIGFWGAYKRRSCLLGIYLWTNVAMIVITLVVALASVIFMITYPVPDYPQGNDVPSTSVTNHTYTYTKHDMAHNTTHFVAIHKTVRSFLKLDNSVAVPLSNSSSSAESSSSTDFASSESDESGLFTFIVIAAFVSMFVGALVLLCKVYSLVLAHKMRQMLLRAGQRPRATIAPVPAPTPRTKAVDEAREPLLNPGYPASAVHNVDEVAIPIALDSVMPAQPFAQHHGMMYVSMPNGQHAPMAVFLNQYGQPVYYTYQPTPADQ